LYRPATLDEKSVENGILKYRSKRHFLITHLEFNLVLEWMTWLYGDMLNVPMWSYDEAVEQIDGDKASGTPYDKLYGNLKKFTLRKLNFWDLLEHFLFYDQMHCATLKDELRLKGKLARLFVPVNVCLVAVANWLFGSQNQSMIEKHKDLPIKVGLAAPASEAHMFFMRLRSWTGVSQDADGTWYDALTNLDLLMLVRELRKKFIDVKYHKLVDRYYDQIHNGTTTACGYLFNLQGQLSGQTNTTADNSLVHSAVMCLHAIRQGLSYSDFKNQVEWYVVGDDLVYNTKTELFSVQELEKTWNSLGMFIESRGPTQPNDLTFVGMTSCKRNNRWLYTFRGDKLEDSMNYHKKGATYDQIVSSLVNLTSGCFADKPRFERMKQSTMNFVNTNRRFLSQEALNLTMLLDESTLLRWYTGRE
jgi:hypothetical protein